MRRIDVHELADHARFTALPTVVAIMASALVDHSRSASAHHVNVGATIAEPEFEAGNRAALRTGTQLDPRRNRLTSANQ